RFCDLRDSQACGLDLFCAEPMPGHIDDVIHSAQNAEVAVRRQYGPIRSKIWPVTPVFAVGVLAILPVVLVDETLAITPHGLDDPRPRIGNAGVARLARYGSGFVTFLIGYDGVGTLFACSRTCRLNS